jgi:rhodanese-related sulfurtransferase
MLIIKPNDVKLNNYDYILDVRTENEVKDGKIKNSINIPLSLLPKIVHKLNKTSKYLIYCRTGRRSINASKILAKNGITNIDILIGNFKDVSKK